jgi:hypothetical protein
MEVKDWIAAAGVIGTWLLFVAAIWGERIRSSIFQPELRVKLDDPRGVALNQTITYTSISPIEVSGVNSPVSLPQTQQYTRPARYYYLEVSNTRRWPVAHDVRVLLTRVERPDPSGVPLTIWAGEIPFGWEHAEVHPASRNLGRPARADFVVAAQDPKVPLERQTQLHLLTVIEPNNLHRSFYTAAHIRITVIATSNEVDSRALRLEISWDGQWNAGEAEMAQHLVIRPV